MKILLIGDFSASYDEGLKNIAKNFYSRLASRYVVRTINVKQLWSLQTLKVLCDYDPQVIHYFTAPTMSSLVFLKVMSLRWKGSKTAVSALHPKSSVRLRKHYAKALFSFCKPDAIFYQHDAELFSALSRGIYFLPNGVDTTKFRPVSKEKRENLRAKYGFNKDVFLILHVGHMINDRNLDILLEINRQPDSQLLIIGGTYLHTDNKLLERLKTSGCKVMLGYVEQIQEFYAMSDCYVFPVLWGDTIGIPLTVLEAMACNLPVVTMNYPTLSQFENGDGFYLANNASDITKLVDQVYERRLSFAVNNRKYVEKMSWESVVTSAYDVYCDIIGERP